MAKLAIKGHATRSKEVIEILEMLGGNNHHEYVADSDIIGFSIGKGTNTIYCDSANDSANNVNNYCGDTRIFTLEEFLEKFPYKVRDKVIHNKDIALEVVKMYWDDEFNIVRYDVQGVVNKNITLKGLMTCHLQPYKEETMDKAVFDANDQCCNIMNQLIKKETMEEKLEQITLDIPDGYEFFGINDDNKVVLTKKQPQYPKTYEECCKVLNISYPYFKTEEDGVSASTYKNKLFGALKQLIICRDAYWKIAGDWKFDFDSEMYYLCNEYGEMQKFKGIVDCNAILAFPTAEMRDAFFENFKDLIEQCKELL